MRGISPRSKLLGQTVVAAVAAVALYLARRDLPDGLTLSVPISGAVLPLGWWFVPLAIVVIVGSSNAVNLTDGLDGLAGGCLVAALVALGAMAYSDGHAATARSSS